MAFQIFPAALCVLSPVLALTGSPGSDLASLNTTQLPSGALVWVQSESKLYALDKLSTDATDLPNIVAAGSGPGAWFLYQGPAGPEGPTGPAIPKIITTSSLGITPSNTATQNSDLYDSWKNQSAYFAYELVFDGIQPGGTTYNFSRPLDLPLWRTLRGGSYGVTLRYTGPALGSGESFIRPFNGGPIFVEDLTVSVRDGSTLDGLADYCIESHGTLSPNVAGPTVGLSGVAAQFANVACVRGLNCAFVLRGLATFGGPSGLLLEGCSESSCFDSSFFGHEGSALRIRGSGSPDSGLTNGGKFTGGALVVGSTPGVTLLYGLELDGVANCVITGITVEGASQASIWCRENTTNVWIYGARSNAGTPALFDGAALCTIEGGCTSTQIVRYINGARLCAWKGAAESFVAPVDIEQRFGALEWRANIRPDGRILALDNTAPTSGFFEVGQEILRRVPAVGQPNGWRVSVAGDPPTVIALPNL